MPKHTRISARLSAVYRDLKAAREGIEDARVMLKEDPDEEFKAMLLAEIEDLEAKKLRLEQRVKGLAAADRS